MSAELLKEIVVKVTASDGTHSISGSGVITKNREGDYFVITAEHCINGKTDARLNNIVRENITIQYKFNNEDPFRSINVSEILHCDEKQDIAVLSIASLNGQTDKIGYSKINRVSDCKELNFRGFPKWLIEYEEADTYCCSIKEVGNETFLIKADDIKDDSLLKSISETSNGISGSGIFEIKNEKIYLIGIITNLRDPDGTFGHLRCAKLDSIFDKFNFEAYALSAIEQQTTISISAELKEEFIGEILSDDDYIERTLSEVMKKEVNYFEDEKQNSTLAEILNVHSHVFIVGNPGSGKSTELRKLAASNWKEGDINDYVPIFKSLKNFSNADTVDVFLPSKWIELNKILLILDGIDEISDIESFRSKLEHFIDTNRKANKNIKYVLSCRTNIYESFANRLSNFRSFYIQDLTHEQGVELLCRKCTGLKYDNRLDAFIKNPYLIDIVANYITEKGKSPTNTAALWKAYIDKRLSHDKKDKLKKLDIVTPLIKKYSKKISLINELMKTNIFDEDNLFEIVKDNVADYKEFLKNPLLEKQKNEDFWFFEHRNIQEYFAAKVLSELSVKKMKKNILIKGTKKTHPTLFNTITFLINILEADKYEELVAWFIENEPELLFKADSNRTDTIKVKVFQGYFKTECVDKSLWITTNKTFSIKELADFANCAENFYYLLKFVKDESSHRRVFLSALKLLCFFDIPVGLEKEIKNWCIEMLKRSDLEADVKSNIIQFITIQNLIKNDREFLNLIFDALKEEKNQQINSSLLFMIRDIGDLDSLFWYLKQEFLRINKIVKRNDGDDVHRGNAWVLNELVLKLNNSNFFIELISYHFKIGVHVDLNNGDAVRILDRCLFFNSSEDDFISRFLLAINGETEFYKNERLLREIITKSEKQAQASTYLIENNDFNSVRKFLAEIATSEIMTMVAERFRKGLINAEQIEFFRNNLWHYAREFSYEFDSVMRSVNFSFKTPLHSEEELSQEKKNTDSKHQKNFDILFNKEELLGEIKFFFDRYDSNINQESVAEIKKNWYEDNGYWRNTIDTSIEILYTLVHHYKESLTFSDVEELLNNDFVLYDKIRNKILANVKSNITFEVSEGQKDIIYEWCIKTSSEIKFDEIITVYDDSYHYGIDYEKFKIIMDLTEVFDFSLPQNFLLDCLVCFEVDKFKEQDDVYDKLISWINDEDLFNAKIVENLLHKRMFSSVVEKHVNYALDHLLIPAFPAVRSYFRDIKPGYNIEKKLEKYFNFTNDVALLKECCEDIHAPKCWSSIKILLESGEEDEFCFSKAIEYLDSDVDDQKKFYLWDALSVLFQQNRSEAIAYYYSLLDVEHMPRMYYSNYSAVDYDTFEEIFFKTYKSSGRSDFNYSGEFMTAYIGNLSRNKDSYNRTQQALNTIKNKLDKDKQDSELFYINVLIDNSTSSYINSKSKPMSFSKALKKVQAIMY